ncbi:sodium-dependent bicarbonate transport family permease [Waterburya agarophytonicola K14]|uniref:Sodium-dependent bicarbonate transport family permease n=1 Tax=Waterburya agarophytonicola KI4 TaxID=2874699 RepID=A0A964BSK9_9CYAN|nr:sodium-dependent bicarbonate transport family permease [Waterburya agarophytonicola]MCC0178954.1 sodium-dependent bicarbonate transport family permease [Waterburya agarophytonicola KI4]
MDSSLILSNILNPPVLFFFIGMIAVFLKSDLEIPHPLPKLFSLYLLFAIGFKGGHEIHESGINSEIAITLLAAVIMAAVVPIYAFFILKIKLDAYNAAAIAASYGSISAVTFVTASSFLEQQVPPIEYGGHMVAALALMESPAIIVGLILVRLFTQDNKADREDSKGSFSWSEVLREAFLNGSVFLLLGSLLVGIVTSEQGWERLEGFTGEIFYGMLTFFLLDMGLVAARRIGDLIKSGSFVIGFSILMPVFNALVGIFIARAIGISQGNALLFAVLCSSASYIAVPAAIRMTVPEANPSLYISMALALTFPFNIIIGIPIYLAIINRIWG